MTQFNSKKQEDWGIETLHRLEAGIPYPECILHSGVYMKDGFVIYPECEQHHYF